MYLLNRFLAMTLCAVLMLGVATSNNTASEIPESSPPRPNIVVVLTDDQDVRLGSMGFMPQVQAQLADEGMTFTNFYVPLPLCCPSRVTLLRGQYAHNHQVVSNLPPTGGFQKAYETGVENATIATALRQYGYRTALVGKYLNGYPLPENPTYIPPGWDEWFSPTSNGAYGSYNYTVNDNGVIRSYGSTNADYITDVLAHEAVSFITRTVSTQPGTPFFLELAFYAPHTPANPAQRHTGLFPGLQAPRTPSFNEPDMRDKPSWLQTLPLLTDAEIASIDTLYRRQMQSLQAVDEAVAQLVLTLAQTGQLDNTYIIFTSDNGFHMGQHRLLPGKGMVYEEDIAVPFIVRGPGVPAGTTRACVCQLDRSCAHACRPCGRRDGCTGRRPVAGALVSHRRSTQFLAKLAASWNLIRSLQDKRISRHTRWNLPTHPTHNCSQTPRKCRTYTALRTAGYKYVEHRGATRELYDLVNDPYELRNVISDAAPGLRPAGVGFIGCIWALCRQRMPHCRQPNAASAPARPTPQAVCPAGACLLNALPRSKKNRSWHVPAPVFDSACDRQLPASLCTPTTSGPDSSSCRRGRCQWHGY